MSAATTALSEATTLFKFQAEDLAHWNSLKAPRSFINANEVGLGKSIDAIVCGVAQNYARILVVSLASTRAEWKAHFEKWWPEREPAAEINKGFARKSNTLNECFRLQAKLENPTHIVSPQLLPKLLELHRTGELPAYDYIVVDEFHRMQSWHSAAFQALWEFRKLYSEADFKMLSGTPLNSDPLRAWPVLKLLEPSKWGNIKGREMIPFQFRRMYGEEKPDDYAFSGFSYSGVNQARLPAYKAAVAHLIRRKTVAEVGVQLPPMRFEVKRYPEGDLPEDAAADWAESVYEQQSVAIFTHNIANMDAIQAALVERKVPHVRIYQEQSVAERKTIVEEALAGSGCVVLATTGLVSTGVNYLANLRTWMLAQPSENPTEIQQLAGRFARLSSKDRTPRIGYLLYQEGEEFSAQKALEKKLKLGKQLVSATDNANALESTLAGRSAVSILDSLRALGRQYQAHAADDDESEDEE